ncbi:MAG TPA: hypothetical protein VF950_02625 [Planctomycetota bacterium]
MGQKMKATGDVVPIAVSLDYEKPPLVGYAQRLGKDWTVLCESKGYESRTAKEYGVRGLSRTFILDGRGRLRFGGSLLWSSDECVEDLRIEAFWAKKRGVAAPATPAQPSAAPNPASPPVAQPAPAANEAQWIFHLKGGGKIKVISYEEADGKYVLKLPTGSSTVLKENVERITKPDLLGK